MRLLTNAQVYAPEPLGLRSLLLGGGQVLWMGQGTPPVPPAAELEVTDLEGARLIPGLIDLHAHVTGGGGEAGPHTRVPPVPLSRFTRAGVTTVVGVLGTDDVIRTTAELVTTLNGLRALGLSAYGYTGGYHLPPVTLTGSVRGDLALVDCLIGVGELALSDHRSSQPTLAELLRVAADAHVGGLMGGKAGILHLHLGDGPRGLALVREALDTSELAPRVFHPTHVNRRKALFEEAIELARRGCNLDLTAFPVDADEDGWEAGEALLRYLASGAPAERITVSSDGGGCLPVFDAEGQPIGLGVGQPRALAETLQALVAGGEPLERVLPAFTLNAARLLRLPHKGRIAPGCDADLVVLDGAGWPVSVLVRGAWFVKDGGVLRRGPYERFERMAGCE